MLQVDTEFGDKQEIRIWEKKDSITVSLMVDKENQEIFSTKRKKGWKTSIEQLFTSTDYISATFQDSYAITDMISFLYQIYFIWTP